MSNLATHLGKLEAKLGIGRQPPRVVLVRGGRGRSGEVSAFLAAQGIREADGDLTVFHTIYEARDGGVAPEPLELVSITPMGGGRRSAA